MSLYYSDEHVKLYHGDCLTEHREWLTADVLVTDPPYGMAYTSGFSKYVKALPIAGDSSPDLRDRALAAWGARPALVFGTWRVPRPTETRAVIVWDKGNSPGMGDLRLPWGPSWEECYVLGTDWVGKRGPSLISVKTIGAADAERPDHPTPKPVPLMERLLLHAPPSRLLRTHSREAAPRCSRHATSDGR
jgi:DNA modification methylase